MSAEASPREEHADAVQALASAAQPASHATPQTTPHPAPHPTAHPLDRWLPEYQFVETHSRLINASPAACIDAAAAFDPGVDSFMNAALALREAPGRLLEALGRPGPLKNRPRFGLHDFLLLARDGDHSLVHGLAGAFWRTSYGLRRLDSPAAWLAFQRPGEARLALSFHTEGVGHQTRLVTTTRIQCFDASARRHFTPYWWLIRPVSGLIRRRILRHIQAAAEAPSRPRP